MTTTATSWVARDAWPNDESKIRFQPYANTSDENQNKNPHKIIMTQKKMKKKPKQNKTNLFRIHCLTSMAMFYR